MPLAAVLNWARVVTTTGVAVPPPVVPPFIDAQPTGLGVAVTNAGMVHADSASAVLSPTAESSIGSVQDADISAVASAIAVVSP